MPDILTFVDQTGAGNVAAAGGLVLGLAFGFAAQRSRFCMRAAAVEIARGRLGPRLAVWLLCFSTAVFWTQLFHLTGLVDLGDSRVLLATGSVSGALAGGLMFGAGMVLARGCSGRLLVLAGTGNLRALLTGLVFTVTAQISLRGVLSPAREEVAFLWTTGTGNVDLSAWIGHGTILAVSAGLPLLAIALARRNQVSTTTLFFGSGVGFAIAAGWLFTYTLSGHSFDPVPVESIAFTGPSADSLMFLLAPSGLDFDVGLIPGVFLGAFLAAWLAGELELVGFGDARTMTRYLGGAVLMGVGGMLAGGCAIGAGLTGASAFALTAWIALVAMWVGAGLTDALLDRTQRSEAKPELVPATR